MTRGEGRGGRGPARIPLPRRGPTRPAIIPGSPKTRGPSSAPHGVGSSTGQVRGGGWGRPVWEQGVPGVLKAAVLCVTGQVA